MEQLLANPYVPPLILTAVIILVFPLIAGYIVLAERKVLADLATADPDAFGHLAEQAKAQLAAA